MKLDNWESSFSSFCLALTFEKLGQRVESDAHRVRGRNTA